MEQGSIGHPRNRQPLSHDKPSPLDHLHPLPLPQLPTVALVFAVHELPRDLSQASYKLHPHVGPGQPSPRVYWWGWYDGQVLCLL